MIKIEHLSKEFRVRDSGEGILGKLGKLARPTWRTIQAVDDLSLEIGRGEIVGYLGPNGAGKSTTIKMLTGILYPSAGRVEVNGLMPQRERKRNAYNIGVVFGQRSQLSWDMPLVDTFDFLAAMYRIPPARYRAQRDLLVELLDIHSFLHQPVRLLSLGQRMRGEIAAALMHEPPLLYLDEPTVGLDILAKNRVLQFLKDLNAEKGTTILLTTHNLSDVEQVCPRIVIIDKGQVRLDMPRSEMLRRFGKRRVLVVRFEDHARELNLAKGKVIRVEENEVWIEFNREEVSAFELIGSLDHDKGITDVSIQEETIESIVAGLYQGAAGGQA
jgi:ABC-2 type transport system ATP-binding protein